MEELPVSEKTDKDESLLKRENICILSASLLLGVIFDILFYGKAFGASYPIFVLAFYAVILWYSRKNIMFKLDFGWLLGIPILMLSLTYVLFSNEMFYALNFIGIPILVIAQTLLITGNSRHKWFTAGFAGDIIHGFFIRTFGGVFKPFKIVAALMEKKAVPGRYSAAKKVFIGIIVSIPLLLIIVTLLSSADRVFEHFMGEIPKLLKNINLGEYVVQIIIVIFITTLIFSYTWSLLNPRAAGYIKLPETGGFGRNTWDPVIIATILVVINIIYLFFTFVQFSYLFGSLKYGLPGNFSYSEYARRGFFELIAVTLINFSILVGCINFTKKSGSIMNNMVRSLNSLLVVCTIVMLFSAYSRMSLYEEVYGYTYLRMLTHAFMIFLFVVFLITFFKIWNNKLSLLKSYVIVALISYLIINFMNIDVVIAKNNIDRYFKTGKIDAGYLTSLSYDAIPQLTRMLDCKDKAISGKFENYLYRAKDRLAKERPWQSFNISIYRAKVVLSEYEVKYDKQYEDAR